MLRAAGASPLNNLSATVDPTAAADRSAGYSIGSRWFNTVNGVFWVCQSAAPGAAMWTPMGAQDHPGYASGRRYGPAASGVNSADVLAANTLYAQPTPILFQTTISGLGLRCATGVAAVQGKLGLYDNAGNRIVECTNDLDLSTSGEKTGTLTGNITLPPGVYWEVLAVNGLAQVNTWAFSNAMSAGFSWFTGGTQFINLIVGGSTTSRMTAAITYVAGSAFLPTTLPALTLGTGTPGSPYLGFTVA